MSTIATSDIQSHIVAYLKSKTAVTDYLDSADEIREDQYQGTEWYYPCVRVRMISNTPNGSRPCSHTAEFGVQVYSETQSSAEADEIAGIIANELHSKSWKGSSLHLSVHVTNIVPALRADMRTWRSEVLATAYVSR